MSNSASLLMDNLFDLKVFVDVVETGSFTHSAERLGISRSAVGKCVARLENRIQIRLLHRTTRSLRLSDEGQTVYEGALKILHEVAKIENELSQGQQQPKGLLRITAPVIFGRLYIMPIVKEYVRRWPNVEVDVHFSDDYSDIVGEGFDLAIRIGGNDDNRLIRKVLAPHRMVTCASPAYLQRYGTPQSISELVKHQKLAFKHRGSVVSWQFHTPQGKQLLPVSGRLTLNDTQAILDASIEGEGICQLGVFLVGTAIQQGRLLPILSEFSRQESSICALYPTKRYLPLKVSYFLTLIDECWQGKAIWDF